MYFLLCMYSTVKQNAILLQTFVPLWRAVALDRNTREISHLFWQLKVALFAADREVSHTRARDFKGFFSFFPSRRKLFTRRRETHPHWALMCCLRKHAPKAPFALIKGDPRNVWMHDESSSRSKFYGYWTGGIISMLATKVAQSGSKSRSTLIRNGTLRV